MDQLFVRNRRGHGWTPMVPPRT